MAAAAAVRPSPWSFVLRAIISFIFGALMLAQPSIGVTSFVLAYGLFLLADGIVALAAAILARRASGLDWPLLLIGLLGIAVGLLFLVRPLLSVVAMAAVIAVWIILVGVMSIASAIRYRRQMRGEWLIVVAAIFPTLFGLYLLASPALAIVLLPVMIGGYALYWAALMTITALQSWRHSHAADAHRAAHGAS